MVDFVIEGQIVAIHQRGEITIAWPSERETVRVLPSGISWTVYDPCPFTIGQPMRLTCTLLDLPPQEAP